MILTNGLNFDGFKYPNAPKIICCSVEGENDRRKYFMINLHDRTLPTQWGSNPQPPDH